MEEKEVLGHMCYYANKTQVKRRNAEREEIDS